jgi:hypothetical protein
MAIVVIGLSVNVCEGFLVWNGIDKNTITSGAAVIAEDLFFERDSVRKRGLRRDAKA